MEQITLKDPGDVLESLESEAEEQGDSRSEYLRHHVIASRHDADDIRSKYEERLEELRAEHQEEVERL